MNSEKFEDKIKADSDNDRLQIRPVHFIKQKKYYYLKNTLA